MKRLAVLALVFLSLAPHARAIRPITPPAPELPPNQAWLNGAELNLTRLRGRRVVLLAFINTASMNSVRTLPILNTWWERYNLSGLMVIGVHTPDFDFDSDPLTVKAALKRFGIRFPVVLDNDGQVWKAFANEGWPGFYLVDHKGRIVFDRSRPDGSPRKLVDVSRLKALGWTARIPLEDGLLSTYAWYREHADSARAVAL